MLGERGSIARDPLGDAQVSTPGRALDLATGTGRHALRLAEAGFEVDALDISAVALGMARERAAARGLRVNTTYAMVRFAACKGDPGW